MLNIISDVAKRRVKKALPRYQKIIKTLIDRGANESDTVTVITDILEDVFGYDKYSDITSEYRIQNTYCDLAVKTEGVVDYLIEVKPISTKLKASHLKQAVNYAARSGIQWVVLTNGVVWELHKVSIDGIVKSENVWTMDILNIGVDTDVELQSIWVLCKGAVLNNSIDKFYKRQKNINPYTVAALCMTPEILGAISSELNRINPKTTVTDCEVMNILKDSVLRGDVMDDPEAMNATDKIIKGQRRARARELRKIRNEKSKREAVETVALIPEESDSRLKTNPLYSNFIG